MQRQHLHPVIARLSGRPGDRHLPTPAPARVRPAGNAQADQITAPVAFEGVQFATATNAVDPQTGVHVAAPSIESNGTTLSGKVQSFGVSWNNQQFNQGSPKPDGSSPGNTAPVTGTYNPATGVYVSSGRARSSGTFNGFSAFWNLTGRFVPARSASPPTAGPAPGVGRRPHRAPTTAAGSSPAASHTGASPAAA